MKAFKSLSFGEARLKQLLSTFRGYVIIKDNIEYEVIDIREEDNAFKCLKLFDSNHIQLNREYYIQNELFTLITFDDALALPHKLLSFKESKALLNQYTNNLNAIMKVHYLRDQVQSSSEQFLPNKIEPSSLDINDYLFETADNQIINVKNRRDNSLVKFLAIEVKKASQAKQIELYYSLNYKNINIIHIHILDEALSALPIEGIVVDSKFDTKAFKEKTKSSVNENNRVFILCKAMKPVKIYHKGKKVCFTAQSFVHERLYQIRTTAIESSFDQYYVKIKHIPLGYLIRANSNDKIQGSSSPVADYPISEKCSKSNNIKGYIDVNFLFDESKTSLSEDLCFAFPPCALIPLDSKDEIELDKLYLEHKKKKSSYEMQKYELIKKELKNYLKYNEKEVLLTELPKETIKKMLFTLKDYQSSAQMIAAYIEQKEMWEKLEDISNMQTELNEYIQLLSKYQ